MQKMNILITGRPGIGKTTLIKEIAKRLGDSAGGFFTEEIRKNRVRSGFRIQTLDGQSGILSAVDINSNTRVGKYRVDVPGFEKIAIPAIEQALATSKVVIVDEIGPMELFSHSFKEVVLKALDAPNPVVATIKLKGARFAGQIKARPDVSLFRLDFDNRERVSKAILAILNRSKSS